MTDKEKLKERNRIAKQKERERKRALGIPVNSEKQRQKVKEQYQNLASKGLTRVTMDIRSDDQVKFEIFCARDNLTYAQAFQKLIENYKF